MEEQKRKPNKPQSYAKIDLETRMKLIELISSGSLSISKAAKALSLKLSTAKLISKRFRQEGTYFEKRSDRQARKAAQAELQNATEHSSVGAAAVEMEGDCQNPLGWMGVAQGEQAWVAASGAYWFGGSMNGFPFYLLSGNANTGSAALVHYRYL